MGRLAALSVSSLVVMAACGKDSGRGPALPGPVQAAPDVDASAQRRAAITTPLPLVPQPRSVKACEGSLAIDRTTRIAADGGPEASAIARRLTDWLGLGSSAVVDAQAAEPTIELHLAAAGAARDPALEPPRVPEEEAYTLDVSPRRAVVRASSPAGLFFGAQTLAQLAGARRIGRPTPPLGDPPAGWSVPCVAIDDAPRFPFRAMHLDVARHFFGNDVVARWVDLLSFYRFNVFHWHLTDDQGFRFEVKGHPELTSIGGRDGFYTQEQARDVVGHARDRFVTVVPEVEMPGHVRALLAAHPELSCTGKKQPVPRTWGVFDDVLCAGNEKTYVLLEDVLEEVAAVFPSRLVHVGGDEVPATRWSACPKCRAAIGTRKNGRLDTAALQGRFMQRVSGMLSRLGRRPVVWDEALDGDLPANALVIAWQSRDRGRAAAERAHDVVMAPHDHLYFNVHQSRANGEPGHEGFIPWTTVHAFDPVPEGLDPARRSNILGGEGTLWTEYIETEEQIETMAMPRLAALAEVLWSGSPGASGAAEDFAARLREQRPMLDASGVRYFVEPPVGLRERKVFLEGDAVEVRIEPPPLLRDGVVRWTQDGSEPTIVSPVFTGPVTLHDTTSIAAALFLPNGRSSPVVRAAFVKETPRPSFAAASIDNGAECAYFESELHRLPDFAALRAVARARTSGISLADAQATLGGRMRKTRFALLCEALFEAPTDGVHRFVVRADDGVRVSVDGETVVEDDGEHEPRESEGEIALRRGHHRIRVAYFQNAERMELSVKMQPPGGPLATLEPLVESAGARSSP